jgi:hypothetical protein
MSTLAIQATVLILMLISLPMIFIGANTELLALTIAGVAVLAIAAATPPALRFLPFGSEEDE